METRPFLDHPTRTYISQNILPILVATALEDRGVIIGETENIKEKPLFIPDGVLPLFDAVLEHPAVAIFQEAFSLTGEIPKDLSPEEKALFKDLKQRNYAERQRPVVAYYRDHPDANRRNQAKNLSQHIASIDGRVARREVLEGKLRKRITTVILELENDQDVDREALAS